MPVMLKSRFPEKHFPTQGKCRSFILKGGNEDVAADPSGGFTQPSSGGRREPLSDTRGASASSGSAVAHGIPVEIEDHTGDDGSFPNLGEGQDGVSDGSLFHCTSYDLGENQAWSTHRASPIRQEPLG